MRTERPPLRASGGPVKAQRGAGALRVAGAAPPREPRRQDAHASGALPGAGRLELGGRRLCAPAGWGCFWGGDSPALPVSGQRENPRGRYRGAGALQGARENTEYRAKRSACSVLKGKWRHIKNVKFWT